MNRENIVVILLSVVIPLSQLMMGLQQQVNAQKIIPQEFLTYQSQYYGFKIKYPPDWHVKQNYMTAQGVKSNNENPTLAFGNVEFSSNGALGHLAITLLSVGRYLDVNDLKIKSITPHDFVSNALDYMTKNNNDPTRISEYKPIRNMAVSIGVDHYPAWRLDYINSGVGALPKPYVIDIYTVIGDKEAFKFEFDSDQLLVPTYLPIVQKMIDSFQFTANTTS